SNNCWCVSKYAIIEGRTLPCSNRILMKKTALMLLLIATGTVAKSQLQVSGRISLSDAWSGTLYVLGMDRINLNYGALVDSIELSHRGLFKYTFPSDSNFLLYKLVLKPKGLNRSATLASADNNFFLLSTADSGPLELVAYSDSLYYSLCSNGGRVNRSLLVYRDHARPLHEISKNKDALIQGYDDKAEGHRKEIVPRLLRQMEEFKRNV